MVLGLDFLVCIVGLIIYLMAKDGKNQEIGHCMFWVGLLAFLLSGEQLVILLHKLG